ncbi:DUF2490 domain-containing protein [Brumimicrobium oceani]|uniref:DUF2490 domain-containing protein n=1 Tax=Brumimicrobium oceani TaxID=2100725 RepID=A0A2U2XE97_9FLAO|nr:DUF2490 domain-containing protein [Brumimicrobium oceani]PWH86114.1 hypothetical protein DIT68_06045 [Brumimicrobium oceani]
MSKYFLFLLLLVLSTIASAQITEDARLWTGISISKEFNDLEFTLGTEYRLDENFSHTDKVLGEIGAEYKLSKRFSAGANYRYARDNDYEEYSYELSHRFDIGVEYDIKFWEFKFKNRVKYQIQTAPIEENNPTYIRNKTTLEYKIENKKKDIKPFISYEFHYQLNDQMTINRSRFSAGSKFDLNKRNSIKLFYIYEYKFNRKNLQVGHIYGVSYSIDLK